MLMYFRNKLQFVFNQLVDQYLKCNLCLYYIQCLVICVYITYSACCCCEWVLPARLQPTPSMWLWGNMWPKSYERGPRKRGWEKEKEWEWKIYRESDRVCNGKQDEETIASGRPGRPLSCSHLVNKPVTIPLEGNTETGIEGGIPGRRQSFPTNLPQWNKIKC